MRQEAFLLKNALPCFAWREEGRVERGREESGEKHIVHSYLNNKIEKDKRNITGKVCMSA